MKIRTDFVTNSSSSNFTVEVMISSPNRYVSISENRQTSDGGSKMVFNGDLKDINSHLSSVEELATWLAGSIHDYWESTDSYSLRRKKERFIREACTTFKSVRDIDEITVKRRYDAWGEMADLIADNDRELVSLAQKYLEARGETEKMRAEAEMVTYINTASDAIGESFGNAAVCRYNWDGRSLEKLAKRLCSSYGPGSVSGVERKRLNLRTGEYFDTSDFDLV